MKNEKVFVFGLHAVSALITNEPSRVSRILVLKDRLDPKMQKILHEAQQNQIAIEKLSRDELDRMTNHQNHQGIIALCHQVKIHVEHDLAVLINDISEPLLLLILDGVQDPHNLGACLRTADAAGVHAVIAPKDKSVGMTPTVAKVASGAAETVPFIQVTNLARTMRSLQEKNIWIYGAAHDAEKVIYQADFKKSVAIVMGAEGKGMRRLTREHCDELFSIPMQGSVSSLNVSVATGIFLFEAVRQRL